MLLRQTLNLLYYLLRWIPVCNAKPSASFVHLVLREHLGDFAHSLRQSRVADGQLLP